MARKKKQREMPINNLSYTNQLKWNKAEKAFWAKYFNNPPAPENIPKHRDRLSFRSSDITDEEIGFVVTRISSINMLDLDDAYITSKTVEHLTRLEHLGELRLKGCTELYDDCVTYLTQLKGLELLHLVGTNITLEGLVGMHPLSDLKKLFISVDPKEKIEATMLRIREELPQCAFYINYRLYEFINSQGMPVE
jgi:hypothetical protein